MKNKKLLKTAITVIIVIITCYLIYDNYYLIANKLEYLYSKYIKENVKQTLNSNEYQKNENYEYVKINKNAKVKEKDEIKYKNNEFEKTYIVERNEIIKNTDWSYLEEDDENKITLITCVENEPEYRRCVQAVEKEEEIY